MCEVSRAVGILMATRRAFGSTMKSSFNPSAVTRSRRSWRPARTSNVPFRPTPACTAEMAAASVTVASTTRAPPSFFSSAAGSLAVLST